MLRETIHVKILSILIMYSLPVVSDLIDSIRASFSLVLLRAFPLHYVFHVSHICLRLESCSTRQKTVQDSREEECGSHRPMGRDDLEFTRSSKLKTHAFMSECWCLSGLVGFLLFFQCLGNAVMSITYDVI